MLKIHQFKTRARATGYTAKNIAGMPLFQNNNHNSRNFIVPLLSRCIEIKLSERENT